MTPNVKGVDVREYRYVGFIRTLSFSKAIGLFDADRIVSVELSREVQKDRKREKVKDVVYRDTCTMEAYVVNWAAEKDGGAFPVFPKEKVGALIHKAALGDFVVHSLRYQFTAPKLARYLNDEIRNRALSKGKDLKDVVFLPENCVFYADFQRNNGDDLKALPYLKELNQHEIETYRFKLGVLDFSALFTERAVKYGEKERIPVTEDPTLIRYVLTALNWDGWDVAKRTVEISGSKIVVKPAALREYRMGANKGWTLAAQREVE